MKKKTIHQIMTILKPHKVRIILSFLLAFVTVILQLLIPILIGRGVDILGKDGFKMAELDRLVLVMAAVIFLAALTQWIMGRINNHITISASRETRKKLFGKLGNLSIRDIDRMPGGDFVSRIITDVDTLSDGLLMGFTQLFSGIITILFTLFFMFSVDVKISLVVVLLTPMSILVAGFISRNIFDYFHKQSVLRGSMTDLIDETIGNEKLVQTFSLENRRTEAFSESNRLLTEASLKATFMSSLVNPSTRFINNMIYALVALIGAITVMNTGRLTVGELTIFLGYAMQYGKPFNEISGVMTELENAAASCDRVFQLLEQKDEEETGEELLSDPKGEVEFKNVYFSYTPEQHLIEDFSLKVKPGMRVAIVGPTGCGKSTLINLLMRFYDVDQGSILVDGRDIREVTRDSLRRSYGMVLQETWLKCGTVRENICYGGEAADEEVIAAARFTHADSFIRRLPKGYDTVITEGGGELSQGQRQLLCITRVLMTHPAMLILDEATSSIDTRTEHRVQRAFAKMMQGRTSFVVAHRLSTIREADLILVMKDGNIIEQGTHKELLARGGFYSQLYRSQFEAAG